MYKKDFVYKVSASTDSGSQKIFYIIVFAGVVMAMLFGLFAVTANPIIISLAIALLAGTILLVRPTWIIWLILILGLLTGGVIPIFFEHIATRLYWGIALLGFLLMFIAFIQISLSSSMRKGAPTFIWIALGFMVYAVLNSLIQWHSAGEFLTGSKRYFQMWGLLFALCWLVREDLDIRRFRVFLLFVALVQLPFVVYQHIFLGPQKAALGGLSFDVIGGTFGTGIITGGNDAEMAVFLLITLAFLLARQKENVLPINRFILLSPLVVAPLFLSETKAIFIMLPLMFLVLYRYEILKRPHYGLIALIFCLLLVVIMGYIQLDRTHLYMSSSKAGSFSALVENTLSYNVYSQGWSRNFLNRTTVLSFWADNQGIHDPASFLFGNGLGSSHDGTGGHIAKRYPGYGIGLTTVSTLLWDMGIFGLGLFVTIFVLAWCCADRLRRESAMPTVRADAAAIQAAIGLFAFYIFYRIGMLEIVSFQIVFATVLGYLAWLYRRHVLATTDNNDLPK
ncbi:hypothetical protein [Nitrosomonas sp.]|uniref:hypothetical protein n=1 Tax=Nitrosomonas sp. TaxID=42353 RepID=UPI0027307DA9|nr:hypothetical protein [Nitrosomonas sp.]MDP2225048.1 hypothetical protein [Nitrosomonas sp.]